MASKWYGWAWAFIVVVAVGDLLFAVIFTDTLSRWELNPLARWAKDHGLLALVGFKFATVALPAILVWYCYHSGRRSLAQVLTLATFVVYALLLVYYLIGVVWGLVAPPPLQGSDWTGQIARNSPTVRDMLAGVILSAGRFDTNLSCGRVRSSWPSGSSSEVDGYCKQTRPIFHFADHFAGCFFVSAW